MSVGPTIVTPMLPIGGAPASANSSFRMNCCIVVRPAPPYSFGQAGAIQPRSASFSRHWPKRPPSRRKPCPPERASGRPAPPGPPPRPSPAVGRHVGRLVLQRLKGGDGPAELVALLRVVDRDVERLLGQPDEVGALQHRRLVGDALEDRPGPPLLAEAGRRRHAHVLAPYLGPLVC